MPGTHNRGRSRRPLSKEESEIATQVLLPQYDVEKGCNQWCSDKEKNELVKEVNAAFLRGGLQEINEKIYTIRKLRDWLSNKLYRDRLNERKNSIGEGNKEQQGSHKRSRDNEGLQPSYKKLCKPEIDPPDTLLGNPFESTTAQFFQEFDKILYEEQNHICNWWIE